MQASKGKRRLGLVEKLLLTDENWSEEHWGWATGVAHSFISTTQQHELETGYLSMGKEKGFREMYYY